MTGDSCVIGAMVWCNGGWECVCCSAVNDGSCSPWVMCSCSVVRGNQIRDSYALNVCSFRVSISKRT